MYLVQILLPVAHNNGEAIPEDVLVGIRKELSDRFGGLTAYSRAPAKGVWEQNGQKSEDDVVMVEVMTDELDRTWWRSFREKTERTLGQEELVVRAEKIERL